ncbi:MAG: hypothetical protein ACXACX_15030 [Candidatus Hodarchaeales archaeon]
MELRTIKLIFIIAGIYDIILGLMTLFLTEYLAILLKNSVPSPLLFPQATGLFLLALGYMLIYATKDIKKYAFIGFASLFVRYSYVVIIILTTITQTVDPIYLLIALTDFITGTLLLATFFSNEIDVKDFFEFNS